MVGIDVAPGDVSGYRVFLNVVVQPDQNTCADGFDRRTFPAALPSRYADHVSSVITLA